MKSAAQPIDYAPETDFAARVPFGRVPGLAGLYPQDGHEKVAANPMTGSG